MDVAIAVDTHACGELPGEFGRCELRVLIINWSSRNPASFFIQARGSKILVFRVSTYDSVGSAPVRRAGGLRSTTPHTRSVRR